MLWQVWHLWCLFYPFPPLCVSASPPVLPHWAVLLRLKYWSLLRLTLSWQSICHVESPESPVYFLSIKFRWPFLLLFLRCLCNHLLSFYDSEDKKNQALKKNFWNGSYTIYIAIWCINWNSHLLEWNYTITPSFTQVLWSCGSAVVTTEFLLTSLTRTSFPPGCSFCRRWEESWSFQSYFLYYPDLRSGTLLSLTHVLSIVFFSSVSQLSYEIIFKML